MLGKRMAILGAMGESAASDGFIKKAIKNHKMKKAVGGNPKYSKPVKRAVGNMVDRTNSAIDAGKQRRAARAAKRGGASEVCTKEGGCKTKSPLGTFKNK